MSKLHSASKFCEDTPSSSVGIPDEKHPATFRKSMSWYLETTGVQFNFLDLPEAVKQHFLKNQSLDVLSKLARTCRELSVRIWDDPIVLIAVLKRVNPSYICPAGALTFMARNLRLNIKKHMLQLRNKMEFCKKLPVQIKIVGVERTMHLIEYNFLAKTFSIFVEGEKFTAATALVSFLMEEEHYYTEEECLMMIKFDSIFSSERYLERASLNDVKKEEFVLPEESISPFKRHYASIEPRVKTPILKRNKPNVYKQKSFDNIPYCEQLSNNSPMDFEQTFGQVVSSVFSSSYIGVLDGNTWTKTVVNSA